MLRFHFRLFPPDVFETFIDVGHYVRDLEDYAPLVKKISTLPVRTVHDLVVLVELPQVDLSKSTSFGDLQEDERATKSQEAVLSRLQESN